MEQNVFRFSRVVVIESLEERETKTGRTNAELLTGELTGVNSYTPVEYYSCSDVFQFRQLLSQLTEQSSRNNVPLLHIECHGDKDYGLEFSDGTTISWDSLARLIFPLNLKTGCSLMLCLSACHAAQFLTQMGNFKFPCPCRILVAPETIVNAADCIRGFREFYMELFRTMHVDPALEKINSLKYDEVRWIGVHSESWFQKVVTNYISDYCSKEALRKSISDTVQKLRLEGHTVNVRDTKKAILSYLRSDGLRMMYEKFFGVDIAPEIDKEFGYLHAELLSWTQQMRELGRIGF